MKDKIKLTKTTLQKLVEPYNFKLIAVKPVTAGIENTSAFIITNEGKYVLRVYKQSNKTLKWIQRELDFMAFLTKAGVPVPSIILNQQKKLISTYTDGKKTWSYIIMSFVEGRHLKASDYDLIPELARYQAVMHRQSIQFAKKQPIPKNFIQDLLKYIISETESAGVKLRKTPFWIEVNRITKEVIQSYKSNLQTLKKLPHGLVHLDYDSDNIIVHRGKVKGIIDFDDISNLPFIVDLANTLWWWAYMNRNKDWSVIVGTYLRHYQKVRKLSKTELSFLPLFLRIRNVGVGIVLEVNKVKHIDPKESRKIIEFDKVLRNKA